MHFHKWTNWQDVKLGDELRTRMPPAPPMFVYRQVITQQRRCTVCNMVETRTT